MVDEARADYTKALGLNTPAEQKAVLKAAIPKVAQAREAYGRRWIFSRKTARSASRS